MSPRGIRGPRRVAVRRAGAATRRSRSAAIRPTTVKWRRKLIARRARARRRKGNQTLAVGHRRVEREAHPSVAAKQPLQPRTPATNPTVRGQAPPPNPALRPSAGARGSPGTPRRRALTRPRAPTPRHARAANHGVRVRAPRTRNDHAADLRLPGTLVLATRLEARPLAPRCGERIPPAGPAVEQLLVGIRPRDRGARETLLYGTGIARGTA